MDSINASVVVPLNDMNKILLTLATEIKQINLFLEQTQIQRLPQITVIDIQSQQSMEIILIPDTRQSKLMKLTLIS